MNWQSDLPDSDILVLVRVDDVEEPVSTGFHDGEVWRYANAGAIEHPVLGWMHLHDAAAKLDAHL